MPNDRSVLNLTALGAASVIAFFAAAGARGQDVFNSQSQDSCSAGRAKERQLHEQRFAELEKKRVDVQAQYQRDMEGCHDPNCSEAADRKRDAGMKQIDLGYIDENNRFGKASIDIERGCQTGAKDLVRGTNSEDPCEAARAREDQLHDQKLAELEKKRIDVESQFLRDRIECNGPECSDAADRKREAGMKQVDLGMIDEGARNSKAYIDIEKCRSGARGLGRPSSTPSAGSNVPVKYQALIQSLDDCLRGSHLTYYSSPRTSIGSSATAYDNGTVFFNPGSLDHQTSYGRAYYLADAFAKHVVNLETQRFGVSRNPRETLGEIARITGYLTRCLVASNVLQAEKSWSPDDPRVQFQLFLGRKYENITSAEDNKLLENDFNDGWLEYGAGLPPSITHQPE